MAAALVILADQRLERPPPESQGHQVSRAPCVSKAVGLQVSARSRAKGVLEYKVCERARSVSPF